MSANYQDGNFDVVLKMLIHPETVTGLIDAGARVNLNCNDSMSTNQLRHWARRRTRGEGLPIEFIVKKTHRNASLCSLKDRGTLKAGKRNY